MKTVVDHTLYDGDQLLAETDAAGALTATYVYGPGIDEPLQMTRGSVTTFYHPDGLGSIVALTNATGAVIERTRYDAFGAPDHASTLGNRFLFTGREYDQDTGLYFYRARSYDPRLGRFLSRDPWTWGPEDARVFAARNAENHLQWLLAQDERLRMSPTPMAQVVGSHVLTTGASVPLRTLPYLYVGSVGKPLPYFKPINETNAYLYTGNNPITRIDPLGLWYIDVNFGVGWWGAVATGGLIFSDKGLYYYVGGGVGTPGPAGAVTWSPFDPTPGWNFGVQVPVYGVFGGQGGTDLQGNLFVEGGIVSLGAAGTAFYVQPIWESPKPKKK